MDAPDTEESPAPLSAERLRLAFARMLGHDDEPKAASDPDAVTPEAIVEAILFVGGPDGEPIPTPRIAERMRDVSPEEVERIAERLDERYAADGSAMTIQRTDAGLRLGVRVGLERVADRLRRPIRATRLSQAAIETLAVVAYRQPITAAELDELRGQPSGPVLGSLERLGLIQRDAADGADVGRFQTTARFLRLLRLGGLDQLPRVAELDD